MDIKWYGNSCIQVKGKKVTLVIDPDREAKGIKGELVLSSLGENTAEVEGMEKSFDWPGEYEVKGVPIVALRAWTKSRSKEEEEGGAGEETIIFYFEVDGIKCCHLDNIGHVLTSEMVNKIGDVDILMINLGTGSNLTPKKMVEIVEAIEPRVLIPMGDGNYEDAFKELSVKETEEMDKYSVTSTSSLPEDKRICISLKKD